MRTTFLEISRTFGIIHYALTDLLFFTLKAYCLLFSRSCITLTVSPFIEGLVFLSVFIFLRKKKLLRKKNKALQSERTSIVIAIVLLKQRSVCIMK